MKLILSELQRDLRHRLAVYAKTAKADKLAEAKRHALLQNSQLWRLLQVAYISLFVTYLFTIRKAQWCAVLMG